MSPTSCFVYMYVRESDLPRVEAKFGRRPSEVESFLGTPGVVCAVFELEHAAYEKREALASEGLAFYGWHGAAQDFGPCRFVSVGGRTLEIDALVDGTPAVPVTEDGEPEPKAMRRVREFLALEREAKHALGVPRTRGRRSSGPEEPA